MTKKLTYLLDDGDVIFVGTEVDYKRGWPTAISGWQKMALAIFGHLDSSGKFAGRKEKVADIKSYVITRADQSQSTHTY